MGIRFMPRIIAPIRERVKADGRRRALAARIRKGCSLPPCLGFGVSSGEDAARLAPHGDGVVCGSAVVALAEKVPAADLPAAAAAKVAELRAAF